MPNPTYRPKHSLSIMQKMRGNLRPSLQISGQMHRIKEQTLFLYILLNPNISRTLSFSTFSKKRDLNWKKIQ